MGDVDGIRFQCPHCPKQLRAPGKLAGKRVRCPNCATLVEVPAPADDEAPPATPSPRSPQLRSGAWQTYWPVIVGGGALALAIVFLLVAIVVKKRADTAPPVAKRGDPEADKEIVFYYDMDRCVARFTPKLMGKADAGEELALFVLKAFKNGRTLDEEIAAGHFRGDIMFRYSPHTNSTYSSGTIVAGRKILGDMDVYYDVGNDGKPIEFGLSKEDAKGKVSAAIGVKTTVGGNFKFLRFVTPVSVLEVPSE